MAGMKCGVRPKSGSVVGKRLDTRVRDRVGPSRDSWSVRGQESESASARDGGVRGQWRDGVRLRLSAQVGERRRGPEAARESRDFWLGWADAWPRRSRPKAALSGRRRPDLVALVHCPNPPRIRYMCLDRKREKGQTVGMRLDAPQCRRAPLRRPRVVPEPEVVDGARDAHDG